MKCKICSKRSSRKRFLSAAFEGVRECSGEIQGLAEGVSRLLGLDYLVEIQKNSLTGVWAKEVAKHLIEEEEQKCLEK